MSSQENEPENRVVGVVLVAAILMVVGLALGFGVFKASKERAVPDSTNATAVASGAVAAPDAPVVAVAEPTPVSAPVVLAALPTENDSSVLIENGVVKMYFASGQFELASGALVALGDAIDAAKAGKRLEVSGFHDAMGDPAMNAELARKRAMSVRNALVGAGVPESALDLKKPEQTGNSANPDEARRVEVTIVG
jgi:outer membrane protein OmpA-like peptidoglycan-associated protein